MRNSARAAIAVAAHPDDIEFSMAGTLLLLRRAGWTIHYFNLLSGNCGSLDTGPAATRRIRRREARRAAARLGARWHAPIGDDLELVYEVPALRRVASVIRDARPAILLTHAPHDYMEDHMTACRLAVTAAFGRGAANFRTVPPRPAYRTDLAVYHAMPHGLQDGLRRRVAPGAFVNTTAVHEDKLAALAEHRSQQEWLRATQGMDSYLESMTEMSRAVGRLSRTFRHAEGWRRRLHLGFSRTEIDPLRDALGPDYLVSAECERGRKRF